MTNPTETAALRARIAELERLVETLRFGSKMDHKAREIDRHQHNQEYADLQARFAELEATPIKCIWCNLRMATVDEAAAHVVECVKSPNHPLLAEIAILAAAEKRADEAEALRCNCDEEGPVHDPGCIVMVKERIAALTAERDRLREDIKAAAVAALAARVALTPKPPDIDEAYHQLYMFAERFAPDPFKPWDGLESIARAALDGGGK